MLDKANLVGNRFSLGKNGFETGVIFYGLFIAPKVYYCLVIVEVGIVQEHKTFKKFNDRKRLLDRSQYFKMIEGKKYRQRYQILEKKLFVSGILVPTKMRFCNECNDKRMCNKCDDQGNESK